VSDVVHHLRAKVGGLSKRPNDHPAELIDAKQRLKSEMLRRHIREVVRSAPPLTESQLQDLATLLAPALKANSAKKAEARQAGGPDAAA
jgi:hypothetical protein